MVEKMTVRRGATDYQQAGPGGIIWLALLNALTLPQTYEQRRIMYRGVYSAIVAKLEVDVAMKNDKDIGTLIGGTKLLLDQAGRDYLSSFEDKTFGDLENKYCELLAQILDDLWELAIKGKLIEKAMITQDKVG
jgi:hypothetical protein